VLRQVIADYEASLPNFFGWPNWVIGSHDAPRIAARLGEAQARVAAMLLLTLRGTPTLYQGDELGIGKVMIPPDRVRDPREIRQPGIGIGRDPSRTPMPWDNSRFAGFSTVAPWLPLNQDLPTRNVAKQEVDPASILRLPSRSGRHRVIPATSSREGGGITSYPHAENVRIAFRVGLTGGFPEDKKSGEFPHAESAKNERTPVGITV
jgi:glycosidase